MPQDQRSEKYSDLDAAFVALPEGQRKIALERLEVIRPLLAEPRTKASVESRAMEVGVSIATVYRWLTRWRACPHPISLIRKNPKKQTVLGDEVKEYIKELWFDLRCRSMVKIHREVKKAVASGAIAATAPSYWTVVRYCRSLQANQALSTYARYGRKAYYDKQSSFIIRDYTSLDRNDIWVGDHHELDLFCFHKGRLFRPWLTAKMDLATRKIVGYVVVERPSSRSIARCLKHAISRCGIPRELYLDNGKDYTCHYLNGKEKTLYKSHKLTFNSDTQTYLQATGVRYGSVLAQDETAATGVFNDLGINVRNCLSYNPRAKAIERWFRTLEEDCIREVPGWCGNSPSARPGDELDKMLRDLERYKAGQIDQCPFPSIEEVAKIIGKWIEEYNSRPHASLGISPNEAWERGHAPLQFPREESLHLLLYERREATVSRGLIKFMHGFYSAHNLWQLNGRKVEVRFDPDNLGELHIFVAGKYWGMATEYQRLSMKVTKEELQTAIRKQRRQDASIRESLKAISSRKRYRNPLDLVREARQIELIGGGQQRDDPQPALGGAGRRIVRLLPKFDKAACLRLKLRPSHDLEAIAKMIVEG